MSEDSAPATMHAESSQNFGVFRTDTSTAMLQPVSQPPLADDYILVQTVAVAVNPTDWTTLDAPGAPGTLIGCDYAGIVVAVGVAVTKSFKLGDRVCGIAHGANDLKPWTGAFASFITVKGDLQIKVPDDVSLEAACTVGVAVGTSGWALWRELGLLMPKIDDLQAPKIDQWILIYGGSTATGTIAIQLAKLVVTTASPKHFDLLYARGADLVLDYRAADVGDQIRQHTNDTLQYVLDCVALPATAAICATALGPNGGIYCSLLPEQCPREDVKSSFFLGYSLLGEDYIFESEFYEAIPDMYNFNKEATSLIEACWNQGKLTAHPQQVGRGGLLGVFEGMQQMKEGKVSGVKLVYRIDDTLWPDISPSTSSEA